MIEIILLQIFTAFYIQGLIYATSDGNVLEFLPKWLGFVARIPRLGPYLYDGLINCAPCMSTIHGAGVLLLYLLFKEYQLVDIFTIKAIFLPVYTFGVCIWVILLGHVVQTFELLIAKLF